MWVWWQSRLARVHKHWDRFRERSRERLLAGHRGRPARYILMSLNDLSKPPPSKKTPKTNVLGGAVKQDRKRAHVLLRQTRYRAWVRRGHAEGAEVTEGQRGAGGGTEDADVRCRCEKGGMMGGNTTSYCLGRERGQERIHERGS